jgi:hypothetical protein
VEEHRSAHRVTQRLLEPEPSEETDSPPPEEEPLPDPSPPPEPAPAPVFPRGPSDIELRKRQRAWFRERARYEASRPPPPSTDDGPK